MEPIGIDVERQLLVFMVRRRPAFPSHRAKRVRAR